MATAPAVGLTLDAVTVRASGREVEVSIPTSPLHFV
jgi:hypothetical protein